jgi:hypothetical protein
VIYCLMIQGFHDNSKTQLTKVTSETTPRQILHSEKPYMETSKRVQN